MATDKNKYIEAVGRRKTAVARVRITEGKPSVEINGRTLDGYFATKEQHSTVNSALAEIELPTTFHVTAQVKGGGAKAQAAAVRHGIARALVAFQADLRSALKRKGFLKRDPRMKERRKFGLRKARRAPQWSKR
jgi:small subunit ribosomal protein S9